MERKYYEVEMSKYDKRSKTGKKNETSMCIIAVREPSIKEAEKFLAHDIVWVFKCDHIDTIREISQEEAYSVYSIDEVEDTCSVFGM